MVGDKPRWCVSRRICQVSLVVGGASISGIVVGFTIGPVGGITTAASVASATAAVIGLWRAERRSIGHSREPLGPAALEAGVRLPGETDVDVSEQSTIRQSRCSEPQNGSEDRTHHTR
jgi:hypothetical protein